MKLMLAGDLHIGRGSTRLPDSDSVDPAEHTTAAAWDRLVEAAIDQRADLLLLSGDVVDQDNKFWEAIGRLLAGVRRLADAGVRTFAVAGNHDHDVLPRLADQLPPEHFTLLGRGGQWEAAPIERGGETLLRLVGWSFPSRSVSTSPLETFPGDADLPGSQGGANAPTLALVHGDLDQPDSRYAPLNSARLRAAAGVDAWLLGHIHAPRYTEATGGGPWTLYPGSPQAMDPGEPGAHGVWLCEVHGGNVGTPTLWPLSSVRYEPAEVDLTGAADQEALDAAVIEAMRRVRERVADEPGGEGEALKVLAARMTLVGRSTLCPRLPRMIAQPRAPVTWEGVAVWVEKMFARVMPAIDLARHAQGPGHTPVTMLARLLLALDAEGEEKGDPPPAGRNEAEDLDAAALVRQAGDAIKKVHAATAYHGRTDAAAPSKADARGVLRDQAMALLGELLDQRRGAGASGSEGSEETEPSVGFEGAGGKGGKTP